MEVQDGTTADVHRAVKREAREQGVYSWIRRPDRVAANAACGRIHDDPAKKDRDMPFDGTRMVRGGFAPVSGS